MALLPKKLPSLFAGHDLLADGLMTVEEAATYLRIGRTKVYDFMAAQDLPYVKLGKSRRIPKVALRLFAEKG